MTAKFLVQFTKNGLSKLSVTLFGIVADRMEAGVEHQDENVSTGQVSFERFWQHPSVDGAIVHVTKLRLILLIVERDEPLYVLLVLGMQVRWR